MTSDRIKLKAIATVFGVAFFFLNLYLWFLILKHINATDYMWFIWAFFVFFGAITIALKDVIFETEKRIKSLEERVSRVEGI